MDYLSIHVTSISMLAGSGNYPIQYFHCQPQLDLAVCRLLFSAIYTSVAINFVRLIKIYFENHMFNELLYSTKFLMDRIFADWPFTKFHRN